MEKAAILEIKKQKKKFYLFYVDDVTLLQNSELWEKTSALCKKKNSYVLHKQHDL